LLGDSGFRDTMSAAAMERAHAMLSWTAVAQRTSALNLRS